MNHWFTAEDFVRLTQHLSDRRIFLHQIVVYQDASGQHVFKKDTEGILLREAYPGPGIPSLKVTCLTTDGRSMAEIHHETPEQLSDQVEMVWNDVAAWLQSRAA